jgi:hypothetical protein
MSAEPQYLDILSGEIKISANIIKYGTFVYVIDVQFLFLMTFKNLYVVHNGNYVLKIARKLKNNFLLTAFRLLV